MFFDRTPPIGRGRWAATDHRCERLPVRGHHVQRKLPAHERLGICSKGLVDSAEPCLGQKHAASIGLVCEDRSAAEHQRTPHGLNAAEFRMLLPPLLPQLCKILGVQLNRCFAAAGCTMVAIPLFENRQCAKFRSHTNLIAIIVCHDEDVRMTTIKFRLVLSVLLNLWVGVASVRTDAHPPNVVLILTDNQGAWTLGCYGNPDIRTPNIDRLAHEGVLFENCFSSNAVCSPTRAT